MRGTCNSHYRHVAYRTSRLVHRRARQGELKAALSRDAKRKNRPGWRVEGPRKAQVPAVRAEGLARRLESAAVRHRRGPAPPPPPPPPPLSAPHTPPPRPT